VSLGVERIAVGYGVPMTETPSSESVEQVEDLNPADVSDRLDKDPDEQENREEAPGPDDRPTGAAAGPVAGPRADEPDA
jgi:hypothetical protein